MIDMGNFLLSFGLNLLAAVLIVRFIYYPSNHNKSYVFTLLALNTVLFFVLSVLTSIELGIGVGFGLFAIFSILRYRTDTIPIREMTYLFVVAALPVLNSAGASGQAWPQIIAANAAIVAVLVVLERGWGFRFESSKEVVYEKIDLIKPERRAELLADLRQRTGLEIKRVSIGKLDFLRDTVRMTIYFDAPPNGQMQYGADVVNDARSDDDD